MTSKDRAALRAAANKMPAVYQIGKGEMDEALVRGVGEALIARELIKVQVQDNSMVSAKEAAQFLAEKLHAEVVQVIGGRFVLYRHNKDINQYKLK